MNGSQRHYLVVGPSWVGDMVMAQSLFISLKQRHPGCTVDVVAPAWSLPVLQRMPEVRRGIALEVAHGEFALLTRVQLGASLRDKAYTHAIVLPRSWKSALLPVAAKVPCRTGYRGEMRYGLLNDIRKLDRDTLTQTVQRYVALAYDDGDTLPPPVPLPQLRVDHDRGAALREQLGLEAAAPVICMMPGAEYGPSKQWPVASYRALAERLVDDGFQVWILGSARERALGDEIASAEGVLNLCGRTELVDVIDLLACADNVVTNDSGLMHVAAAVGTRLNVIYGSTTPDYTPPLAAPGQATVHYLGLECSPCFERSCPLGHHDCMRQVEVDRVFRSIIDTPSVP